MSEPQFGNIGSSWDGTPMGNAINNQQPLTQ